MHLLEKFSCYKYSLGINFWPFEILHKSISYCHLKSMLRSVESALSSTFSPTSRSGWSKIAELLCELPCPLSCRRADRHQNTKETAASSKPVPLWWIRAWRAHVQPLCLIINKPQWRQAAFSYTDTHHVGLLPLVWPPCRAWMISSLMVIPLYLHVHIYRFMNLCVMFCFTSSQSSPIFFWLLCCFMSTGWIL